MRFKPLFFLFLILSFSCVPVHADDGDANALESIIVDAVSKCIVSFCNSILSGFGGVETGNLNDSENYTGEQVAIFTVVAHSINPTEDPEIMEEVETTREIYTWGMKFFALLLTAFLIFQQVWPSQARDIVGTIRGQPGYVTIDEMVEYYAIVCFWLLLGPALLYGALWLNNYLTQSLTLSVLDHVAFSSENTGLYTVMTVLWGAMAGFFATRIVLILLAVKAWYLLGLVLAIQRTRWLGTLSIPYIMGFVFAQFIVVWIVVSVVIYTESHAMSWAGSGFLYLGMFSVIIGVASLIIFWPIALKLLSPKTYQTLITIARYL